MQPRERFVERERLGSNRHEMNTLYQKERDVINL